MDFISDRLRKAHVAKYIQAGLPSLCWPDVFVLAIASGFSCYRGFSVFKPSRAIRRWYIWRWL